MNIFYSNSIDSNIIILDKIESNHCIKVLRNDIDDKVLVVDGMGCMYDCIIREIKNKIAYLEIISKTKHNNYYGVHIAISPIKNHERLEWFIEKAVEIGIDRITFIKCNRTLRNNIRIERLKKIAITAMKQSLKATLPIINSIIDFNEFLDICDNEKRFICYLDGNNDNNIFNKNLDKIDDVCILIGPEGDFTNEEVELALLNKFDSLSLGSSRLRTETAGIVACHLANIVLEKKYD